MYDFCLKAKATLIYVSQLFEWGTVEVVTKNEIGRKIKDTLANIHTDTYIFHGAKEDVESV